MILAKYFADEFSRENKMPNINIAQDAKDKLMVIIIRVNVRELKAMIDLAAVMCNGNEITADDISYTSAKGDETFMAEEKTLRDYTCDIIKYYLKKNDNDVIATADKLNIGKSTIYKMIQQKEIAV